MPWLRSRCPKTGTLWFHGLSRNQRPHKTWFFVEGNRTLEKEYLIHLGITLDGRRNFDTIFSCLSPRLEGVASFLNFLFSNIEGQNEGVHHHYKCVIRSVTQYGTPTRNQPRSKAGTLRRVQRHMSIRITRESRTLTYETSLTLAGMIPFQPIADVDTKPKFSVRDQRYAGVDISKKQLNETATSAKNVRYVATRTLTEETRHQ